MDTFKMPLREIWQKYTKSELVILAWDSRQKAYNMSQMYKKEDRPATQSSSSTYVAHNGITETEYAYEMPNKDINNGVAVPKHFFNAEGEVDLRRATGPQAVGYLRALGIKI